MSGGAGYVLSRESMRRFVEDAIPDVTKCSQSASGTEDLELGMILISKILRMALNVNYLGRCLSAVNVTAKDSRDSDGRGRFFPMALVSNGFWYWEYRFDGSPDVVSLLHYVSF